MADDARFAELPIRSRRTFDADGAVTREDTVLCPARGAALDVETCLDCHHCGGPGIHTDRSLVCLHPAARRAPRASPPVRMPSAAELTALSEIMTGDVVCLRADVAVDSLATLLLERNISAVPVVDAAGRPIGIVSKTDLVRWYHDEVGPDQESRSTPGPERGMSTRDVPRTTVTDLMMPMAFTLTEDAPVAYAAALMTVEGVHHLPIVAGNGQVVGIVSALDIVRWIAHRDGFVVPPAR